MSDRIDSLKAVLDSSYKPGLGEFMSNIQVHHVKLWFAGKNKNWKLADFEINEIEESLADIRKYCTDRIETKSIGMIDEPIVSVANAIKEKKYDTFVESYKLLTITCNNCHTETQHGFNIITIPTHPPFSDQNFKLETEK